MEQEMVTVTALEEDEPEEQVNGTRAFLALQCGRRWLAVPFERARRIARMENYTPLPGAIPLLPGATNVEGYIVPVLDVAPLLNEPRQTPHPGMYLVVIADGEVEAGILTPTPPKLQEVSESHIQETRTPFIEGTYGWPVENPEHVVEILSIGQVLAATRKAYE